jgi:serine/threonine-protein kinase
MKAMGIGFRMAASRLTVSVDERTRLAERRLGTLVLDKWRLDRLIGVGGTAAVFEATHKNGNRVAIKILHSDLAGYADVRARFLAEGYAANRVAHPGVVAVRDEGTTDDGAVFLVMDLLQGQTLAERLERESEPFSVGEVLDIASQLLEVLGHAHARGIVHRDIKPQNVFLARDGRVRLLDFGLARVESADLGRPSEPGTTIGTPAFMPPEQALGNWDELDGRSDLWSLAATMYLLLSSTPVRERGSITDQLLGAMTRPVPSLGLVAALPRSVVAVVDRALSFDRDARFPDANSMRLALRAVQNELGAIDSRATLPPLSLEPVVVSLRTPLPLRQSSPTVRPVALNATPLPGATQSAATNALPFYVTLGFAVGVGIVVAARLSAGPSVPTAASQGHAEPAPSAARLEVARPAPSVGPSAAPVSSAKPPRPGSGVAPPRAPALIPK